MFSNYIMYVPASPVQPEDYLPIVINWMPVTGFITYQIQPEPAHEPWFPVSVQKPEEEHQIKGVKKTYSTEVHVYEVCTLHLMSTFKSTCPGLLNGHLLLDIYHARLSQDLHMDIGFSPTGRRFRETQGAVRSLFFLSLSYGMLTEPHPKYVVVDICQCSCLGMDHSLLWI